MQVGELWKELGQAWKKLEEQPGGLYCVDMLVSCIPFKAQFRVRNGGAAHDCECPGQ